MISNVEQYLLQIENDVIAARMMATLLYHRIAPQMKFGVDEDFVEVAAKTMNVLANRLEEARALLNVEAVPIENDPETMTIFNKASAEEDIEIFKKIINEEF